MSTTRLHHHDDEIPVPRVRPADFRRLGIGVSEARVGVIRHAARAASAAVLAKSKSQPDPKFDDKLALIATSTYRVLDPRGRNLHSQRVQLLRFESPPSKVPHWWEPQPVSSEPTRSVEDHFDPSAADEIYAPAVPSSSPPWDAFTQRLGLPSVSPRALTIGSVCSALTLIVLIGAIGLRSSGDLASHNAALAQPIVANATTSNERDVLESPSSESATPLTAPKIARTSDPADPIPPLVTRDTSPTQSPIVVNPEADVRSETAPPMTASPNLKANADRATSAHEDPFGNTTVLSTGKGRSKADDEFADDDISRSTQSLASPKSETSKAMVAAEDASARASGPNAGMPQEQHLKSLETPNSDLSTDSMPLASPVEATELAVDPFDSLDTEEPDLADVMITDVRHPVPGSDALVAATERVQQLLAELPGANDDPDSAEDILAIRETIMECEPGSADRWVLMHEAIGRLVLAGADADVTDAIKEIASEFQTDPLTIRSEVLDQLGQADTIVQRERIVRWALQTSELALANEDFEIAATATRSATALAGRLSDNALRSRTSGQTDTIRQAKRIAVLANKVISESDYESASASEANSVGRYLCFYRRNWQDGLPWLTRISSPKIAQLAQRELDPENHDAVALIDAWIEVASDERGRAAESILLHGRDLASVQLETASGLEAKDLQDKIDQIDAKLPADLRLPTTSDDSVPDIPVVALAARRMNGMLGRVKAQGLDIGVLIRYEPGLGLTPQAFTQILDQLNVETDAISAEFVGLIDLSEDSTIRFIAGGATQPGDSVAVTVNDQPVKLRKDIARDHLSGVIDLPQGTHLVRWRFGGKTLNICHLSIEDDRNKKAVTIRHTPRLVRLGPGQFIPRLRVNVVNTR